MDLLHHGAAGVGRRPGRASARPDIEDPSIDAAADGAGTIRGSTMYSPRGPRTLLESYDHASGNRPAEGILMRQPSPSPSRGGTTRGYETDHSA